MALSKSNLTIATVTAAIAFGIDQFSKYYVTDMMALAVGRSETMIPGFVTFVHSKNYGINFGLFDGMSRFVLIGLSVAFSLVVMIWAARRWNDGIFAVAVGMVVGGALANAYDRLVIGAVTDFLNVTCCGINNPFAFNIADVAIFAGIVLLLFRTAGDDKRATAE